MKQQDADDIRFGNKFLYSIQKHRIMLKAWIGAKERAGVTVSKKALMLYDQLVHQEAEALKIVRTIVRKTTLWDDFFENITGVAERLATSLMGEIKQIGNFRTVSSLWAYMSLTSEYVKAKCDGKKNHQMIMSSDTRTVDKKGKSHVEVRTCPVFDNEDEEPCGAKITVIERVTGKAPARQAGWHYMFNMRLKTIAWLVSEQMVRQGDKFYRDIYDTAKIYYANRARKEGLKVVSSAVLKNKKPADKPKYISEGHIHNRAKRKMVKIFLFHLWEAWREAEGLTTRPPYVIEKLGHKNFISWRKLKPILIQDKENKAKKTRKKAS